MIKIENTEVVGWEPAIRGMRNPKNSWDKSDSGYGCSLEENMVCNFCGYDSCSITDNYIVGENDHKLMMSLAKGGPVHAKYRRMITVYVDITAPLYWWKEFDTYKVGTVANSCSTMHKIAAKRFTLDDFSVEKLNGRSMNTFYQVIDALNDARSCFLDSKEKIDWWQMIQILPTSYNQKRTVMLNYEVLHNIYYSPRYNHKLDEWHEFCDWIKSLPHSEIILGENTVGTI